MGESEEFAFETNPAIMRRHSLLATPGYVGRLANLTGMLSQFNGKHAQAFVHPTNSDLFLVKVENGNEEVEIAVPKRCLQVAIDGAAMTKIQRNDDSFKSLLASKSTTGGNNRSDVGLAVQGLSSQVRAALKAAVAKSNTKAVFAAFDEDGGGTIDKEEFRKGLQKIGVQMSESEIDLVWPFFDMDGSGDISLKEFMVRWLPLSLS